MISIRPRSYNLRQIMELQEPEFLVDEVLESKSVSMLFGPPGTCKTFLTLSLAYSVLAGQPWCGRAVKKGQVLYVLAEGLTGIPKRLDALFKHHGLDPLEGDLPISIVAGSIPMDDDKFHDHMLGYIGGMARADGLPVSLVVFDTLSRCLGDYDENSSRDMTKLVNKLEHLSEAVGCSILLVHHTTKGGKFERGSSAIRGALPTLMGLALTVDEEVVELFCTKQKESERFPKMFFRRQKVERSMVLVPTDEPAGQKDNGRTDLQRKILEALEGNGPMTLAHLTEELDVPKTTVRSALGVMSDKGEVEQREKRGPYSLKEQ